MNGFYVVIGKGFYKQLLLGLWFGAFTAQAESARIPELGAANAPAPTLDALELDPGYNFLYDARLVGLDKAGQRYNFEGDVILIGGGQVITADVIQVDYIKSELTAVGHVLLLHQNEIFTGEKISIQWKTNDFQIEGAVLIANEAAEVEAISRRILGQSTRELAYEAARKERLVALERQKDQLKKIFGDSSSEVPSRDQIASYARFLEQERLTHEASTPALADRDPERRRRLERRRSYWQKSRAVAAGEVMPKTYYFRLEGQSLERKNSFLYQAKNASFTPCRCAEDEAPAWGFQADMIEAQEEGYIELKHPVLTIKGIPILYLPFLKLPLKVKRQSGFLMPSFQNGEQKNGFVFTQPVFLDLAPNADATVTADVFQKRGTRVGLETRYESRVNSGIRYETELIRDSSWLLLGSQREGLLRYHLLEQPVCTDSNPEIRQTCEQNLRNNLEAPGNSWRGKQEWQGRLFLAPRLSVVTKGKVISDHRYVQDLYLPDDIVSAFFANQAIANAFSTTKARLDFDGKDFYAGIGGAYGDNALANERYSGQQIPAYFNIQTRLFRPLPASIMPIPVYAELQAKTISIDEWNGPQKNRLSDGSMPMRLGSGNWQRFALQLTSSLANQGIVRIDQFAEGELRVINHRDLKNQSSTIRSSRMGLTFNLPIDGQGPLPAWLKTPEQGQGTSYVRHIMNWGLGVSVRPSVVRDGLYGELTDSNGAPLVYFPSDRKVFDTEDIRDEDRMIPHQRLTLSTSHRVQVFDRLQETVPGVLPPEQSAQHQELLDLHERAKQELMSVKDQRPTSVNSMFSEKNVGNVDWYINRYRITDSNSIEPVNFSASMSFDNQQEKLRQEQIKANRNLETQAQGAGDPVGAADIRQKVVNYYNLPESWRGPFANLSLSWKGFNLNTNSTYNIYRQSNSSLTYALSLPSFASTTLNASYVLEKNPEQDPINRNLFFKKVKTNIFGLTSGLIPYVSTRLYLIRKQVEVEKIKYGTSYQLAYDGISGCWGLRLVREKDLNQNEENASYFVQLAIIFLGNQRSVDVSPGIKREFGLAPPPPTP